MTNPKPSGQFTIQDVLKAPPLTPEQRATITRLASTTCPFELYVSHGQCRETSIDDFIASLLRDEDDAV